MSIVSNMDINKSDIPKIDGHIIIWEDKWLKYDEKKDEWIELDNHPPPPKENA